MKRANSVTVLSSGEKVGSLRMPMLFIHCVDDMVIPFPSSDFTN